MPLKIEPVKAEFNPVSYQDQRGDWNLPAKRAKCLQAWATELGLPQPTLQVGAGPQVITLEQFLSIGGGVDDPVAIYLVWPEYGNSGELNAAQCWNRFAEGIWQGFTALVNAFQLNSTQADVIYIAFQKTPGAQAAFLHAIDAAIKTKPV